MYLFQHSTHTMSVYENGFKFTFHQIIIHVDFILSITELCRMVHGSFTQRCNGSKVRRKIYKANHKARWRENQGYQRSRVWKRHGKFGKSGLNDWSISKSLKAGQKQVSGRVSVPCCHATPVANAQWKPLVIRWRSSSVSMSWNWRQVCNRSRVRM